MVFGFFKKKKQAKKLPPVMRKTREQRREEMQKELDEIDFQAAKAFRESRMQNAKAKKRRSTIKGVMDSIDAGMSVVSDEPLRDGFNRPKKKKKRSVIDDPIGDF